jgi:hypothetical protein
LAPMKLHSAYSGYRGEAVAKSLRCPLTDACLFDILQSRLGWTGVECNSIN